jgi:hypothetical protein
VVIGGLVTATALTLFVLPTAYHLLEAWMASRATRSARSPAVRRRAGGADPAPAGAD